MAKLTFSRQNLLFHGKTYFSTAKLTFPWQNLLSHGKTYFLTAKLTFPWQNLLSRGKTYFLTAKLTFPRQNLLFPAKLTFYTAKLGQDVNRIKMVAAYSDNEDDGNEGEEEILIKYYFCRGYEYKDILDF